MKFSSSIAAGLYSLKDLVEAMRETGISGKCIIVSGPVADGIAGKEVKRNLERNGTPYFEVTENIEPTQEGLKKLSEHISGFGKEPFPIVAIGGGKTIDACKYVSNQLQRQLVVIPTLLSSDAIASGYSVIWDGNSNQAIRTKTPNLIVGDYEILRNQPEKYVSSGVGDMLSKVSSLFDWRLSFWMGEETYSDFAMNVAKSTTELLQKRILDIARRNYIGIETLFLAEVTDGYLMELSGTTRLAAGSEHLFTFAIENLEHGNTHGIYCALGTIMMSYLQSRDNLDVRGYLQAAGVPTSASEAGIKRENIIHALTVAHKMRPWYTILGTNGLSEGKAERLAKYTQIIE